MNAYSVLSASSALRSGLAVFRLIHWIPSFPKRRDEAKKAKPLPLPKGQENVYEFLRVVGSAQADKMEPCHG